MIIIFYIAEVLMKKLDLHHFHVRNELKKYRNTLFSVECKTFVCKGEGGEIPPFEGSLSPTAIFNIPDQGCNSKTFFLLLPALFPPLENLISPWPIPPSPEIIWPIPYPHHPTSLPTSPISKIKIHGSFLYFLFPRPHPPPEFFL